nr:MAG TPA: hypothetical protein [Caudoviricetes sp.]
MRFMGRLRTRTCAKIALTFKRRTLWQSHLRAFKPQQRKEKG